MLDRPGDLDPPLRTAPPRSRRQRTWEARRSAQCVQYVRFGGCTVLWLGETAPPQFVLPKSARLLSHVCRLCSRRAPNLVGTWLGASVSRDERGKQVDKLQSVREHERERVAVWHRSNRPRLGASSVGGGELECGGRSVCRDAAQAQLRRGLAHALGRHPLAKLPCPDSWGLLSLAAPSGPYVRRYAMPCPASCHAERSACWPPSAAAAAARHAIPIPSGQWVTRLRRSVQRRCRLGSRNPTIIGWLASTYTVRICSPPRPERWGLTGVG